MRKLYSLDVESYPNYSLLCVGKTAVAELRGEAATLDPVAMHHTILALKNATTYGFNSNHYDVPLIMGLLSGMTAGQLNHMSHWIINEKARIWQIVEKFDLSLTFALDHVDLIEPSPGVFISLKKYGARLHSQKLQDLPYDPHKRLKASEMDEVREYCLNDLDLTEDLYVAVRERIELRERLGQKYGVELRSKSDAQIAEAVIRHELKDVRRAPKLRPGHTFSYKVPYWMEFQSDELNDILGRLSREEFALDNGGKVRLPSWLEPITIGNTTYKIGIGGLHSMEKKQSIVPAIDQVLIDADVASYYPNIILNEGLFPAHIGSRFLDTYRSLVERRLKAKAEGDDITAGGLKITVNGAFGKLASKYSFLYSPDLMLAVTLTGQLALLMLIEQLENCGMSVVSANTDGIVTLHDRSLGVVYYKKCKQWEDTTGFDLEFNKYKALFSRDVNNYLAVKTDGTHKGKGVFAETGLMKDPAGAIVQTAVEQFVLKATPIERTVEDCKDVRQFIIARNSTSGAYWRGEYLGKTVRWIWSTNGEPILTGKGAKVAKSDGACPVMTLPNKIPRFIDYDKYIDEAYKLLRSIGL